MKKVLLALSFLMVFGLGSILAQAQTVTGTVTGSEDGIPIPGVSVFVQGTTVGTVTQADGTYSLRVPDDAETIVFSFVGMQSQEIPFEGQSTINVQMVSEAIAMDEVIVTALGIKRNTKALGYSTSNVGGEELIRSGEQNVVQALAGKASGIQVIGSAGTPGASSKILIRGNSSFTGNNQPLMVVDGVPIDNSTDQTVAGDNPYNKNLEGVNNSNRALDLNPDDIESVTILKGPAAAALYGVRAANGAVLYTTKKGSSGGTRATYEYKLDITEVNKLPDFQRKYSQGAGGEFSTTGYNSWGAELSSLDIEPTNNVEEFFQTGVSHSHNVSVMGGNEISNFRLSFNNVQQEGMIPNTDLERTSIRMSGETEVFKGMKAGGTVNYISTGGNKGQNGSNLAGLMLSLFRAPVSYKLYDEDNGGYLTPDGEQRKYFYAFDNPYWSSYNNTFEDDIDRTMGNVYLNYNYDWLTLDYKLGVDYYSDSRKGIIAMGSYGGPGDGNGEVVENILRNQELYSNFYANASHRLFDSFNTSLSLGHNLNEQYSQNLYSRGRNLSAPDFYHMSNASDLYADESQNTIRTSAVFFIADIDWQDMLYLNATGRNEWASTLGQEKQDFFYPSVSTSFVFSELIPENSVLSFGKMRLGWAKAGNNPSAYGTKTYYTQPTVAAGMTNGLGYPYLDQSGFSRSTTLGNKELKPEMTTGMEGGFDLRFFNGRANVDFTYYYQKTTDILVARPIAPTTGYANLWQNSGEMENKGIELSVGLIPIQNYGGFSWNINANFTKNENEVLKLAENVDEINIESAFVSMGSYAIVGDAYGALYSDMWERDNAGEMVIDAEGYPIIADERGNVGNPFPDWLMNVRNTFSFNNLSLSFLLDIREGGDIWNGTIARLNQIGRTAVTADRDGTIVVDGVTESGEKNDVPISKEDYHRYVKGDWGPGVNAVYDGSWVRLRDLTLSYKHNFKSSSALNNYIKSVTLSATGRNLWLSTDYPGVDPETSLTGAGSNLTGFDYFNMPGSKSYVFSLKANF